MENPINNSVFDSRDLVEYKEHLEGNIVDLYNEWMRDNLQEGYSYEDITDFSEIENWDSFAAENEDETEEYLKIKAFYDDMLVTRAKTGFRLFTMTTLQNTLKNLLRNVGISPKTSRHG